MYNTPEKKAANQRKWYWKNREKAQASTKRWIMNNRETVRRQANSWANRNKDRLAKYRQARYDLRRKFGMTAAEYEQMFNAQNGVCAICGEPPRKIRLHVDHDHKTGKVRGLLCFFCNSRLAHIEDIEWRSLAEKYLEAANA
jgi:hypothetical protein